MALRHSRNVREQDSSGSIQVHINGALVGIVACKTQRRCLWAFRCGRKTNLEAMCRARDHREGCVPLRNCKLTSVASEHIRGGHLEICPA